MIASGGFARLPGPVREAFYVPNSARPFLSAYGEENFIAAFQREPCDYTACVFAGPLALQDPALRPDTGIPTPAALEAFYRAFERYQPRLCHTALQWTAHSGTRCSLNPRCVQTDIWRKSCRGGPRGIAASLRRKMDGRSSQRAKVLSASAHTRLGKNGECGLISNAYFQFSTLLRLIGRSGLMRQLVCSAAPP